MFVVCFDSDNDDRFFPTQINAETYALAKGYLPHEHDPYVWENPSEGFANIYRLDPVRHRVRDDGESKGENPT